MSSNLPFVFDKYKYLGNFYIDGVVCDNFPIDIGDKVGKKVIGLLLDQQSLFSDYTTSNIIEYFFKTLFIPMVQVLENKIKNLSSKCKIISINHDIGMFNFDIATDKKLELFSSGYNQVKNMFKNK
jgi:predicted patatin/cPLA2 family phospholipase